jgi:hypothetical protein
VFSAVVCFLRRAASGELSAPEQYRCGKTRLGDLEEKNNGVLLGWSMRLEVGIGHGK